MAGARDDLSKNKQVANLQCGSMVLQLSLVLACGLVQMWIDHGCARSILTRSAHWNHRLKFNKDNPTRRSQILQFGKVFRLSRHA